MNKKPLVIYHKDCADGLAAAWCFWKQYGDLCEYHPGVYGQPIPDFFFRTVYLVDFSYKRDVVEHMLKYAESVYLLDHHKSAIEDLWDLASQPNFYMRYATMEKSGAMIAWDFIKRSSGHTRELPALLQHIQDRDLWKFDLEGTRDISMAVFAREFTIEAYDELMETPIETLKSEGAVLQRKYNAELKKIISMGTRFLTIDGYEVPAVNANYMYASDIGNILSKDHHFAVAYFDTDEHRVFSLRSQRDGLDVSQIALKFNGGGHKNAAGFKVPRNHPLAMV